MKKVMLTLSMIISLVFGADEANEKFDDFEKSLMEGIEEVSDIATKSKLNIDDTPAFISILYSETFQEYSIDTVYEALALIPGVELTIEGTGAKTVIFRGGREKGKIKLLVDGVPINNTYRGSMYHYLNFPVDLVDRIEVIRGPGSVLYGSNAINGVINIVTKNQNRDSGLSLFGSSGTYDQNRAGFSRADAFGNGTLSLDGYYQSGEKKSEAGADKSGYEGKTDESMKDYSVGLLFQNDHWKLTARTKNSTEGMAYGAGNYLERRHDLKGLVNTTNSAEIQYRQSTGSGDLVTKVGYKNYRQSFESRYYPEAIVSLYPPFGGAGLGDLIYTSDYEESGIYLDIAASTSPIEGHYLVVGAYADHTDVTLNELDIYREYDASTSYFSPTLLEDKKERGIGALYLQDSFGITAKTDMTAGLRWDNYSDYGNSVSPRIACVYRMDEKRNLKAMYSRAFRAPSWVELYGSIPSVSLGNPDMKAETSDTFEIGLVSKEDIDNLLRFNLFYTNINDIIYRDETTKIYTQNGTSHFYGGELEYRKRLGLDTAVTATFSETEGLDKENKAVADIANQIAGIRISHKFKNHVVSGTNLKYVSPRKRIAADTRDELEGYAAVDQTFSFRFVNGLWLSASVKNLLDADVRYPSPPNTYSGDYPREGRTFWLKASWEI